MSLFCRRTFHEDCFRKEKDVRMSSSKKDQRKTFIFTRILENVKNLMRQDPTQDNDLTIYQIFLFNSDSINGEK